MEPFFGSHVTQNVDEFTNNSVLEKFTGYNNFFMSKQETTPFFSLENNVSNPYGMSNLSGYNRDRYIVSSNRNNETPTERIYVGPGLNQGYTSTPSGGFQQANSRLYAMPKTVDELRVKTNPKLSYHQRVLPGIKPVKRGKFGTLQKNRPDTFAVWTPDRYFVTTGDRVKPKQRAEFVLKHSNRLTTDIRRATGPAGPTQGHGQTSIRSNIKISNKCNYTMGGARGFDGSGQWTVPTKCPPGNCNVKYNHDKKCKSKLKVNESTIPVSKDIYYKDKRIENLKYSVHDYGKNSYVSNTNNRQSTYNIPNGNIYNSSDNGYVPIVSDLRPTRKQDFIGNSRWASNVQAAAGNNIVRDPNDIAKTTHRETTHIDYSGNAYIPRQDNRKCNEYKAVATNRQFTSNVQYIGNATGDNEGGYQIANINPRHTNRQYTSNSDYIGTSGNTNTKPKETTCMMKNITSKSYRENVSKGRLPGGHGAKENISSDMIYATTNKIGDVQNTLLNQRGKIPTKVYNSLPQANKCSKTKEKKTLDNAYIRNRLDSKLLNPFKNNPYSQSLESYWT